MVKRWKHVVSRMFETIEPADGEYVLFSDLESAESRIRALEECVREMLNDGDNLADAIATIYEGTIHQLNWEDTRKSALALLGSEGATGEGK